MVPSSASSARQWDSLAACLDGFPIIPFDLYGHGARDVWPGREPLTLEHEASAILDAIPGDAPFHLIGHSYGGGVALKFASSFPHRVMSLTLVEPSCFHLLQQSGDHHEIFAEIQGVAQRMSHSVRRGDYHDGMRHFIDYWSGAGTWASFPEERKAKFARLAVHVCYDFQALFEEPATLEDYARVSVPTLVICGTQSPEPARVLTRLINEALPNARHATIPWAGHMSPITHPTEVNQLIGKHLMSIDEGNTVQLSLAHITRGPHNEQQAKDAIAMGRERSWAA